MADIMCRNFHSHFPR